MRDRLFLLIFFLIRMNYLSAQDPLLRHYTTNDGLPGSTIYPMIQDKEGFIWFGSNVGVTRFDGKRFQNFTLADGLSDNTILKVGTDSRNRVWFLGFNGTVSYWQQGKIHNAGSDTLLRNITSTNSFVDLFEDNENRLWFVAQYEYLVVDHNKITRIDLKKIVRNGIVLNGRSGQIILTNDQSFLSQNVTQNIDTLKLKYTLKSESGYWRLKDESILFISYEGVVWQSDTIQKLIINFHGEFNDLRLGSMVLSPDSLLWITSIGKGLFCYDLKSPKSKPIVYLKNKITSGVLSDREGNIWISTIYDGLYMIPEFGKKVAIFNKGNGMFSNQCYAVSKNNKGQLLVGLNEWKLQLISGNQTSELKIPVHDNTSTVVSQIVCRNEDVWIATESGLIHQNSKTGCNHFLNDGDFSNKFIQRLAVKEVSLGANKIYITSGIKNYEYPLTCKINSGYWASSINEKQMRRYSIYCDHSNQLWYGTIEGLHSKKDTSFFDHSNEDVLLTKRINSITETEDSTLVLATYGYGLLFYKNGKIVNRATVTSGLCNDICRKVFVHKDRIYVSTPSGVSVLYYSKGTVQSVQNLNTGNFLPSNDVNDVFADDKDISVATMEGVAVIGQWALGKTEPVTPLLYLTEVRVNDSMISTENESILPYNKNSLKFNFIGIYYQQPDAVNYRYRLRDDQPWQTTENSLLEFPFLEQGKYIFELQARIQTGNWSPVRSFQFVITPPFWSTFWFRLFLILVLSMVVYIIMKRRIKLSRRTHEEKIKIANQITQLEQQALQTMMNPHFIFNVMNSIQHFINANEKEAANHYLSDFAKLIRMNLTISYKRFIPLEEEIDYLKLYLSFEKLRFGDNLTYEIIVDPAIDINETTVAVMMIQPFIENAVWHGILPMNAKGHISIQIDKEADDLIKITIEDNGIGIKEKFMVDDFLNQMNGSHALSMTIQRLKLLGKSSPHKLFIRYKHVHPELENKGTVAELVLPAMFY